MTTKPPVPRPETTVPRPETLELIKTALAGLRFGEIVIAVHDGEIVQISRTEKIRPPKP